MMIFQNQNPLKIQQSKEMMRKFHDFFMKFARFLFLLVKNIIKIDFFILFIWILYYKLLSLQRKTDISKVSLPFNDAVYITI